jgi:hypothetical protein
MWLVAGGIAAQAGTIESVSMDGTMRGGTVEVVAWARAPVEVVQAIVMDVEGRVGDSPDLRTVEICARDGDSVSARYELVLLGMEHEFHVVHQPLGQRVTLGLDLDQPSDLRVLDGRIDLVPEGDLVRIVYWTHVEARWPLTPGLRRRLVRDLAVQQVEGIVRRAESL